jgi:DNA-binding NarL/FixJ family response regulator
MHDDNHLKILLIEDSLMYTRLLRAMLESLERYQFDITHVDRLAAAFEHLAREPYDLILSDLNLPDSEGLATFDAVVQHAGEAPIVVLSSDEDESVAGSRMPLSASACVLRCRNATMSWTRSRTWWRTISNSR